MTEPPAPPTEVEVRLYAAARAAAGGLEGLRLQATSVVGLRDALTQAHGPQMRRVLESCSFLLDGLAVARGQDATLSGITRVDVLPPFAGG